MLQLLISMEGISLNVIKMYLAATRKFVILQQLFMLNFTKYCKLYAQEETDFRY